MTLPKICEAVDFIARFKPTCQMDNPDCMVIDLRLPREAMQDLCLALTEVGVRYCLADAGTVLWFDRRTWEFLQEQAAFRTAPGQMAAVA